MIDNRFLSGSLFRDCETDEEASVPTTSYVIETHMLDHSHPTPYGYFWSYQNEIII